MMKTKRSWFILMMAGVLSVSLTGCLEKTDNIRSIDQIPTYVSSGGMFGGTTLETLVGSVTLSSESPYGSSDFEYGSFGLSSYSINFDRQPAGIDGYENPYIADVYWWLPVGSRYLDVREGEFDSYEDTILGASVFYSQSLRDHVFFIMNQGNIPTDRKYSYSLILNTDSTKNGIPSLYLQTSISVEGTKEKTPLSHPYAFNMDHLFRSEFAKEETINGFKWITVDFSLYYQSGNDKFGKPIFKLAENVTSSSSNKVWKIIKLKEE